MMLNLMIAYQKSLWEKQQELKEKFENQLEMLFNNIFKQNKKIIFEKQIIQQNNNEYIQYCKEAENIIQEQLEFAFNVKASLIMPQQMITKIKLENINSYEEDISKIVQYNIFAENFKESKINMNIIINFLKKYYIKGALLIYTKNNPASYNIFLSYLGDIIKKENWQHNKIKENIEKNSIEIIETIEFKLKWN